jgi:hypothetical protein
MIRAFSLIILLMVVAAGCLETKEAWPAIVNDSVLNDEGWISAGDAQKQSQTQNVAGTTVRINMAIMNYRDEALAQDITRQVSKLRGLSAKQESGASQFTSQLLTFRLLLPAGISLPSEIMNKIIASQLEQMASQNNIRDFHETGSTKTTLDNGKEVSVKNYEGYIYFEGGSIKIKGMTAAWPDSGSNIIVFAVLPGEDIVITPATGEPVSVKINGEVESQKIIKLIQNVR